jgi:ankyrin repeat protein
MYAAWHANDDVVKFLLAKGADPTVKDSEGNNYEYYLKQNDFGKP